MAEKSFMARVRPWLRAVHRDVGYVAVGLTFIYALSGLAVNHITDWSDGDPSFRNYTRTVQVGNIEGEDQAIADELRKRLGVDLTPREIYRAGPDNLEVLFDKRSLHYDRAKGEVVDEGQEPRFLLRVANWLHLNRGKKAWTYFADAYAAGLLLLATSGIFMIAGKKGIVGRGAVLVLLGILVPVLYVHFAGP
ncbi:MAG: PepSY-associated TM helix domain-containing protein [Labilithrix sp.]|nr:PepSY-associated TM helix domain-containing protein [Labilithrix sp.]MCW5810926.1 PepSY-associated TM helix domain-containing protein [Labilithrix sp.]